MINKDKTRRTLIDLSSIDVEDTLENLGVDIIHRSGDELLCRCPHGENHANGDANPSFSFNMEKKVGMCYVCGPTTLLALTEYMLNVDQQAAEEWLQQQTIPGMNRENLREKVLEKLQPKTKDVLPEYPVDSIKSFRGIHPYIYERGINRDTAIRMQLGYDDRHDAIVIPHFFMNKLRGWQWRHMNLNNGKYLCQTCDAPVPKFKSTPALPKSTTLYNYDNAIAALSQGGELLVVESPLSALKIMSLLHDRVVATFGSWSIEQMSLLAACQNGVVLWPDNDKAGNKNIERVVDYLVKLVPVRIAPLVDQSKGDPGDLSGEQLKEYIQNTYAPIQFKLRGLQTLGETMGMRKIGTPEKAEVVEEEIIEQHIAKTGKSLEDLDEKERDELWQDIDGDSD